MTQRSLTVRSSEAINFASIDHSNGNARIRLAATLNILGLLLTQTDANEEAERTYLEAIAKLSDVPNDRSAILLATIHANLSGLLTTKSPNRAIQYARQSLSGQLDSLEHDRGNAKLATQTIVSLNILGVAQSAAKQNAYAIDTFNRAVEIGKQLLARWPDQPTYRRDRMLSYNHLGLSLSKVGELGRACEVLKPRLNSVVR